MLGLQSVYLMFVGNCLPFQIHCGWHLAFILQWTENSWISDSTKKHRAMSLCLFMPDQRVMAAVYRVLVYQVISFFICPRAGPSGWINTSLFSSDMERAGREPCWERSYNYSFDSSQGYLITTTYQDKNAQKQFTPELPTLLLIWILLLFANSTCWIKFKASNSSFRDVRE